MASFFVDHMDSGVAILISDRGERAEVPASALPPGLGEGRWVTLSLTADPAKDDAVGATVASTRDRLVADDDGGDFSL